MGSQPATTNRIYAFDQLRAIMMMLGVVVHTGTTYVVRDISDAWPVKDVLSTSLLFELISGFVHTFRMPLFFVVSGFFTSMLFFVKGPAAMLQNRIKKIFYPFVAGLIILYPAYLQAVHFFYSRQGIVAAPQPLRTMKIESLWDIHTIHLWFLYYLMMFCVSGWAVALLAAKFPAFNQGAKNVFRLAFNSRWAVLIFAPFTVLCLARSKDIFPAASEDLMFSFDTFITYGYFFLFGWMVYIHQDQLSRFLKQDKLLIGIGVALFFFFLFLLITYPALEKSDGVYVFYVVSAIIPWCFIFGFTGMSLRYLNHYSSTGQYLSNASYWVYLLHLPVIIYLQALLVQLHIHGFIKFIIVACTTAFVTLVTYNYLVRNTFIGKFLSGKTMRKPVA